MMKKYIYLLLFCFSAVCSAQNYQAVDTADYIQRKAFIKKFSAEHESMIKDLKSRYSGKMGNELAKMYKEFGEDFQKQVAEKDFVFNSVFDAKVKSILEKLRKNNSNIPQNPDILIAKDNMPNAFCFADGSFVINMGLFNWKVIR